jgi:hypothetical protein
MCDFEIWNKSTKPIHLYGLRRAKPAAYCAAFKHAWSKITKDAKYLCVRGEPMKPGPKIVDGKRQIVKQWIWDRIKSKNGCYEYFGGDCGHEK